MRFKSKPDRFSPDDYPECDENGSYRPMQCSRNACWCVNKHGNNVGNGLNAEQPKSDEDCKINRSSSEIQNSKQLPVTPPNRDNIFGIPITEAEEEDPGFRK